MGDTEVGDKLRKAREWCDKARQIIGYGLVGQSKQMYQANLAIEASLKDLHKLGLKEFDPLADEYRRISKLAKAAVEDQSDAQVRALVDQLSLLEAEIKLHQLGRPDDQLKAQKEYHQRAKARATTLLEQIKPPATELAHELAQLRPENEDVPGYEDANRRLAALLVKIERADPGTALALQSFDKEAQAATLLLAKNRAQLSELEHGSFQGRLNALVQRASTERHASGVTSLGKGLEAWTVDVGEAAKDGALRAKKKADLLARRTRLADPPGATAPELASLKKARDEVLKLLTGLPDAQALEGAENKLLSAQTLHGELLGLGLARKTFLARRGEVATELKGAAKDLDGDSLALLMQRLQVVDTAADKATLKSQLEAQVKELDKLPTALNQARVFNAARDEFMLTSTAFIALEGVGREVALNAQRDITLQAAAAEAKKGDWPTASTKLAGYRAALGGADPAKLDGAGGFARRLSTFEAQDAPTLRALKAEGQVPGHNVLDNEYSDARKKGVVDKLYPQATVLLDALATRLAHMQVYGQLRREVLALTTMPQVYVPPDKATIDLALQQGNERATANDWVAAKSRMSMLLASKPVLTTGGAHGKALAAVKGSYEALQATYAAKPVGLQLKTLWDDAATKAGLKKFDESVLVLEALKNAIGPATRYLELAAALERRLDAGRGGIKAALLKPAADEAVPAAKYTEACALLQALSALLDTLDAYDARREQVQTLRDAVPGTDPERQQLLDGVLKHSAETAKAATVGSAAEAASRHRLALTELDAVALLPEFEQLDAELVAYRTLLARVMKTYQQVHGRMSPPQAATKLADELAEARKPSETKHDHAGSTKLLLALDLLLGTARSFIDARESALAMQKALIGITTRYPAHAVAIYNPHSKTAIDNRILAANADAVAAKFKDGADKYKALLADCRAMCNTAGEKVEAESYGRCHSMARHGPGVTEPELVTRITTGIAPDGEEAKCESASQFDDPASWLESREKAIEQAKLNSGGGFDPDADEVDYADPLSYMEDIEHPKPIDTSVLGLKEKPGLSDKTRKFEGSGTFETHTTVKGLTRTRSIFKFLLFDPQKLYVDGIKQTSAKAAGKWKTDHDGRTYGTKTIDAYVGEWVLITHYPLTEGWDPETGTYTTPL